MTKLGKLVDFWDSKELHKFLLANRSQLYIRFGFLGCKLATDIYDVLRSIFSRSGLNPQPLDPAILDDWWDFKDRAVKLHSSLEYTELLWNDRLLSRDRHDPIVLEELLDEIFSSFSIIARTCSGDLLNLVNTIAGKQPNVLSYYVIRVLGSSPWMGMAKVKGETSNPIKVKDAIHDWMLPTKGSSSEYSLINFYLRDLHQVSEAIEDGVDFVFKDFRTNGHH